MTKFDLIRGIYRSLLDNVKFLLADESTSETKSLILKYFKAIDQDLDRIFPSLSIFQEGGPLNQPLRNILQASVLFKPDIGYVKHLE